MGASTNTTNPNNMSMPTTLLGEPIPIAPAVATTTTSTSTSTSTPTIPGVAPIAPLGTYNIQDQDHTTVPPPGGTVAALPQPSLFQLGVGVGMGVGVPTTTTTAPLVITSSSFSTDRGGTTAPVITAAAPSPTKSTNEYKQVQV